MNDLAEMRPAGQAEVTLRELTEFCLVNDRGRCFRMGSRTRTRTKDEDEGNDGNWTEEMVREYLRFHLLQGTLVFCRGQEAGRPELRIAECGLRIGPKRIVGVAVGWQLNAAEVLIEDEGRGRGRGRREFLEKPFRWQGTNVRGDAFFICDVIATERAALGVLMGEFTWRVPMWRSLRLFGIRRGKVVEYKAEKLVGRMEAFL